MLHLLTSETATGNRTHKSSWSVLGPHRRLLRSAGVTEDLFVTRELHQKPPPRIPTGLGATEDLFVTRGLHQEPPPRIPTGQVMKDLTTKANWYICVFAILQHLLKNQMEIKEDLKTLKKLTQKLLQKTSLLTEDLFRERLTKTRNGERDLGWKPFERCPIFVYKLHRFHRPEAMCHEDSPFYLKPLQEKQRGSLVCQYGHAQKYHRQNCPFHGEKGPESLPKSPTIHCLFVCLWD